MDAKSAERKILLFIKEYFSSSGKLIAVVGLSGGLDSSVTAALLVRALGRKNIIGVLLPSASTPPQDMRDAAELARKLGMKAEKHEIERTLDSFGEKASERMSRANLAARVRMAILYSLAAKYNGLVVGTGDKSEMLLGYFTKHGDGGADLFPIGGLYKTEVRELGKHLGLPSAIVEKPPSPALWTGHTAEAELGFSYEDADAILRALDEGESKSALLRKFEKKTVLAVLERIEKNRHKLSPAPICKI